MTKASTLRALHVPGQPAVLPNVWDAASACIAADAGFPAMATTSGGIAQALGFDDHEHTPVEEMLAAVARIVAAVDVPVSADMESGYGLDPAELVARLGETGVAGLNIEDTDHARQAIRDPAEQAERIAALRAACTDQGVDLVVNARIDVFLLGIGEESERAELALERARAYVDAGADCVYPILVHDRDDIRAVVDGAEAPVNVLAFPGAPTVAELSALGVGRVTFGSQPMKAAMRNFKEWLATLAAPGAP